MKKILKSTLAMLAMAFVMMGASATAKADDCDKSVDKICDAYAKICDEINKATDLQGLFGINFLGEMMDAGKSIDKECYSYELTGDDKQKLITSFDNVMTSLTNKSNELSDGAVGPMIQGQMQPIIDEYHAAVQETTTLGDYLTSMQ